MIGCCMSTACCYHEIVKSDDDAVFVIAQRDARRKRDPVCLDVS